MRIILVACLWLATNTLEAKIVFHSKRFGDYDIYTIDSDGSNWKWLTVSHAKNAYPVWSPNGQQVAFQSTRERDSDVYVIDADGKNLRNLTRSNSTRDGYPSWSPDGAQIVFESTQNSDQNEVLNLFVMDANGSDVRQITHINYASRPKWSMADGAWILFEGYFHKEQMMREIYVVRSDGAGLKQVSQPSNMQKTFASWSPNGDQILYTETSPFKINNLFPMIATLDAAGQKVIQSERIPIPLKVFQTVVFSADGNSILFSGKKKNEWNIYRFHLHNRKLIQLTHSRFKDAAPHEWNPRLSVPLQGLTSTRWGEIKTTK